MTKYRYTEYFELRVLAKRPYFKREWCVYVIENAVKIDLPGTVKTAAA